MVRAGALGSAEPAHSSKMTHNFGYWGALQVVKVLPSLPPYLPVDEISRGKPAKLVRNWEGGSVCRCEEPDSKGLEG